MVLLLVMSAGPAVVPGPVWAEAVQDGSLPGSLGGDEIWASLGCWGSHAPSFLSLSISSLSLSLSWGFSLSTWYLLTWPFKDRSIITKRWFATTDCDICLSECKASDTQEADNLHHTANTQVPSTILSLLFDKWHTEELEIVVTRIKWILDVEGRLQVKLWERPWRPVFLAVLSPPSLILLSDWTVLPLKLSFGKSLF